MLAAPLPALALVPAVDADLDTMDDGWELANGLNPLNAGDAYGDADGDGVPNRGEYHLGSDPQDPDSLPPFTDNLIESFEGGAVPAAWFVPGLADAGWFAEDVSAQDGSWSLRSDRIPWRDEAEIVMPVYVHHSDVSLGYFWNAYQPEAFRLYIDGELVLQRISPPRGWLTSRLSLSKRAITNFALSTPTPARRHEPATACASTTCSLCWATSISTACRTTGNWQTA